MISCKLQGGLSNQLFQIAATYALALRNNDVCSFDFNSCYTPNQGNPSKKYRDNILSKLTDSNGYRFINNYTEPTFAYNELPYTKDLILNGYFQSNKYFDGFKSEILDLFVISEIDKKKVKDFFDTMGLNDKPITSVHIRRGDYLKLPDYHPVCTIDYYKKAMQEIGNSYFVFISDDMDWVKDNFKANNYVYSTFSDEILDLTLQTQCDNNIIANSSFSWWGAYLNRNENKKIIAPKIWFGPNGPKDTNDLIPEGWIIL